MRIPAVSFDPPVGAPTGVSALQALAATTGAAVSKDGRHGSPGYRRAAKKAQAAQEPVAATPAPVEAPPAEPLPMYYPPLGAQRAVLDRPAADACAVAPVVPEQREEPVVDAGRRAPVPGSSLDQTLRRIIGAV